MQRDRILDLLEAEEAREGQAEDTNARDLRGMAKSVSTMESERKKAAKELQKKMGKALLSSLAKSSSGTDAGVLLPQPVYSKAQNAGSAKSKKVVSFDDSATTSSNSKKSLANQGDVSLTPLRSPGSAVRPKSSNIDGLPMRMNVVERVPRIKIAQAHDRDPDSDDESGGQTSDVDIPSHSSKGDDVDDSGDEPGMSDPLEGSDEDMDLSQAQLQREAALEYFRLRESMGADLAQTLSSSRPDGADPWNRPVRSRQLHKINAYP